MPRPDGRYIKTLPPFPKIIPYIMPRRYDATNYMTFNLPQDKMRDYLFKRKNDGVSIGFMPLIIAGYIRTVTQYPELNRFVMSKKIYARKGIWVSFVTLKGNWSGEGEQEETVTKIRFSGNETLDEVNETIKTVIEADRKKETSNSMDKILGAIFRIPVIPSTIVALIKFADKIGILPKSVINASPFHSSMFFSNMASIRSFPPYHHLYEFGTTGVFLSFGYSPESMNQLQLKVAGDERICSGSTMVRALHYFVKHLIQPELLESPPERVKEDQR